MSDQKPLLSICIPTYNRSKFLRVMLQALLPQVAECGEQIEVWVIDNASPDETPAVVEESRALGPFGYCRNQTNIGPLRNILKGPCELATGGFVWILGDHNLMLPGALHRVLSQLKSNSSLDVFYTNFRCAAYPEQWPEIAVSGYDGPFRYLGNQRTENRAVPFWSELLDPASALCTQVYAHIVRRRIWQDYWAKFTVDEPYRDALTTYPHTAMIVARLFHSPAFYLGEPAITIFNGAQSWGDPETQMKVFLNGLPDLMDHIGRQGFSREKLKEAKQSFCTGATTQALSNAMLQLGVGIVVMRVIRKAPRNLYVWRSCWFAFLGSDKNLVARRIRQLQNTMRNRRNWWIVNCRPVRWLRRITRAQ